MKISVIEPYKDHMVIQRDTTNKLFGKASPNQLITLSIGSDKDYTTSKDDGYFEFIIKPRHASFNPIDITVSNDIDEPFTIKDVLFGDIYLFSGQSNMQVLINESDFKDDDLINLEGSNIRFFSQDITTSTTKLDHCGGSKWFIPDRYNVGGFSAIATMAGSFLVKETKDTTPIGIVTSYQGDTNIANWMGDEYYKGNCSTKHLHYNAMIYPLRGTKAKGCVWYQGCNNAIRGCEYKELLPQLFKNFRDLFNNKKMPFFVIGLACYDGDPGCNFDFSYIREAQALACKADKNAYFISSADDGDPTYIHPKAKRYISERVAKSISSVFYKKGYLPEGPSYKSHKVKGNKVIISLNNADGLYSTGEIDTMYLAGADGKYHKANAYLENNKIIATCDKVNSPKYIRYGFKKSPFINVFNKDGFSMVPFRTDKYGVNIDLFEYDSLDNYTFHQDGSKMNIKLGDNSLIITKENDSKPFGSVILEKWCAVAYKPKGLELTIKGNNSGAYISLRFTIGETYEIWAFRVLDNFNDVKTFRFPISELKAVYNNMNDEFEPQKVISVELMVETDTSSEFELIGAKFIDM